MNLATEWSMAEKNNAQEGDGMERDELVNLVKELRGVMVQKEITPLDAKNVADMLAADINESIARHNEQYIANGKFT